mmetsp:Transcript_15760/g.23080  ORF Transcript_15760/g.23080 Transcript_15760/m.23080 type:complete len:231 (-) Transcript_15760:140-832(-)
MKRSNFVSCPIIHGSVARFIDKTTNNSDSTHKWTIYVRGPSVDDDISSFVSKVVFLLHPSFDCPVREVLKSPFEISELGWGEFEVGIRIYFHDASEQPVDLVHFLKLYAVGPAGNQLYADTTVYNNFNTNGVKRAPAVVSEAYDEIVFADPSPSFLLQLQSYLTHSTRPSSGTPAGSKRSRPNSSSSKAKLTVTADECVQFDTADNLKTLQAVRSLIQTELATLERKTKS